MGGLDSIMLGIPEHAPTHSQGVQTEDAAKDRPNDMGDKDLRSTRLSEVLAHLGLNSRGRLIRGSHGTGPRRSLESAGSSTLRNSATSTP